MKVGIYYNYDKNGPGKVVHSLKKSLDEANIGYEVNKDCDVNIILQDCNRLRYNLDNCLVGPNICTLPIDNAYIINHNKVLVPCEWVKNLYSKWISEDRLFVWFAGIDCEKFNTEKNDIEYDFLIYFKRRDNEDLEMIKNYLDTKSKTYTIIKYGEYNEDYFIETIKKCKYGFVIDNCESQGIAIGEMMSSNLPLLVWDVKEWNDRGVEYTVQATSIPYWDDRCGEFFHDIDQIESIYNKFISSHYNPRDYVIDNLSFSKSLEKIKYIWEK